MEWSSQSSDLNVFENLWWELKLRVCENLVNNYKKRFTAVVVDKGFSTK